MRKVFRPHVVLCTVGRLFSIILITVPVFMLYIYVKFAFFLDTINFEFISLILFAIGLNVLVAYAMSRLWQQIWGKLVLEKDKIIWKCIFCQKVQIEYSNIKGIAIRNFGNRNVVNADIYKTGFQFIIITSATLPQLPIDKVKCQKGIIKWTKTDDICEALSDKVSTKFRNILR